MNKKLKIVVNYFIGPILFIWLSFSIYHQIKSQKDLAQAWQKIIHDFGWHEWMQLLLVVFLMLINWGIESKKWQLLIKKVQPISFKDAFRATLAGQAFAISSLNNIGDFAGKILHLSEGNRLQAIALNVVASIAQITITLLMGIVGLFFLHLQLPPLLQPSSQYVFLIAIITATILLLVCYFNIALVLNAIKKVPFLKRIANFATPATTVSIKELTIILSLSAVRFIIFIAQYLLLFNIFKVQANSWQLVGMICILFLSLAIIPSFAIAEVGIRGELSIQLIGLLSTNIAGILLTSTGIWFINRILPAIIGSIAILKLKTFK